ncbi:MAG: bifunctional adenosylcobinamide kinase/adenosylcobinamide-phosphate guanylyltransferase [Clostridiales bacterium]|nr:bifunctional adenosylcobinamide kinase/adenosylcobinamide-phosphate guanylyltransferase [Clostridiales bacterium]
MGRLIYVTGGARSGKSRFAEKVAADSGLPVSYIATAVACDGEMLDRIARHRQDRPAGWRTVEAWRDLDTVFAALRPGCALLDCVTVMVTNLILLEAGVDWDNAETLAPEVAEAIESRVMEQIDLLVAGIDAYESQTIAVSNEVGMGLSPAYPLGRLFRDIAGRVNQRLARRADEAWVVLSGIPLRIK